MKKLESIILSAGLSVSALAGSGNYATKVLPETRYVESSENALGERDGTFAVIQREGILELELENPAVYDEKNPYSDVIEVVSKVFASEREPGTHSYSLWVRKNPGDEWTHLGDGFAGDPNKPTGTARRAIFLMAPLKEAKYVKIEFNNTYRTNYPRTAPDTIGIDSVKSGL